MGYSAAGLGYGIQQGMATMGDALSGVMNRREERERYETGLRLDARDRQDRLNAQTAAERRADAALERQDRLLSEAITRQETLSAQERQYAARQRVNELRASGEFPDAQMMPGVGGLVSPQIEFGERAPFAETPAGERAQWYIGQGLTAAGNNRQQSRPPTEGADPRRGDAEMVARLIAGLDERDLANGRGDQIAQQYGFGSAAEVASYLSGGGGQPQIGRPDPAPSTPWGDALESYGGPVSGGQAFDPNAHAFPDPSAMIDEERRRRGG